MRGARALRRSGRGLCGAQGALPRHRHSSDAGRKRLRQLEGRRGDSPAGLPCPRRRHDRRRRHVHGLFCRLSGTGHGPQRRHAVCRHGVLHRGHASRRSCLHPRNARGPRRRSGAAGIITTAYRPNRSSMRGSDGFFDFCSARHTIPPESHDFPHIGTFFAYISFLESLMYGFISIYLCRFY